MGQVDSSPPDDDATPPPKVVIERLSLYLRELQRAGDSGQETISSAKLGQMLGLTDAQVRKDLAWFGQFGYPGVGYRCGELTAAIRRILGTDRQWPMALIGVGNLGRALLRYRGFRRQGFRIAAAFDVAAEAIGAEIEGVRVFPLAELPQRAATMEIRMAIIAAPAEAVGEIVSVLEQAGIRGVLNFAPLRIAPPEGMSVHHVDLAIALEQVAFAVVQSEENA